VCHALLDSLLSLSVELCDIFLSKKCHAYQQSFRNYFDCLVLLASANQEAGHLLLARAVVRWLPLVVQAHFSQVDFQGKKGPAREDKTPSKEGKSSEGKGSKKAKEASEGKAGDDGEGNELTNPLNTMYLYLSHLTTAVQYSSCKVDYLDRRAMAAEDDVLFDEDEGEEEMGVANEEDAAQEEVRESRVGVEKSVCAVCVASFDARSN